MWYTATAFALVLVATGFLYHALATNLEREDDQYLADKLRSLRATLRLSPTNLSAVKEEVRWSARQPVALAVRLLDADGRTLLETPGLETRLPAGRLPAPVAEDAEPGPGVEVEWSGNSFRVMTSRAAGPDGGPSRIVQVALDERHDAELLARYRGNLWLVLGLALVASAAGGYGIARRGLRPLTAITATARSIRPANLGERLDLAGLPRELHALAETLNAMLDRLQTSFDRLTRFSGDIAHELRTPVHNLCAAAEVALAQPRSADDYRDVLTAVMEEGSRLTQLIDRLLFLARAEHPQAVVVRERVEVAAELHSLAEFYEPAAADAGITLTVAAAPGTTAELDRPLVRRAVSNLIENALRHTPRGGAITVTARTEAANLILEVADTGGGIAAEHLPHLFDRFYRADPARAVTTGGVGLGLAIVRSVALLHGGTVTADSTPGRGTRVRMTLPTGTR